MNMLLSGNIESSTNQMSFMWLDWQDMITIVISVAALVLAVYQYFGDYRRKKDKIHWKRIMSYKMMCSLH